MNLPAALYAIRWLIHDTFRQARASGILWVMLIVSGLAILLCLSISVHDPAHIREAGEFLSREEAEALGREKVAKHRVEVVSGQQSLAFGAIRLPLGRDAQDAVYHFQVVLAGGVADTLGVLLTLVWTAGFLPSFLDPSAASVLLAKPVPRWSLLAGKYLGVLTFVASQAVLFVCGTWLALGLRTGFWNAPYLMAVPMLLLNFAVFFSFSVLLAVLTRSTVVCVFGSLLFWLMCWGMNMGRHTVLALPEFETMSPAFGALVNVGYWVMPKPADMSLLLFDVLRSDAFQPKPPILKAIQDKGLFAPDLSLLTSLAATVALVAAAGYEFVRQDY